MRYHCLRLMKSIRPGTAREDTIIGIIGNGGGIGGGETFGMNRAAMKASRAVMNPRLFILFLFNYLPAALVWACFHS